MRRTEPTYSGTPATAVHRLPNHRHFLSPDPRLLFLESPLPGLQMRPASLQPVLRRRVAGGELFEAMQTKIMVAEVAHPLLCDLQTGDFRRRCAGDFRECFQQIAVSFQGDARAMVRACHPRLHRAESPADSIPRPAEFALGRAVESGALAQRRRQRGAAGRELAFIGFQ